MGSMKFLQTTTFGSQQYNENPKAIWLYDQWANFRAPKKSACQGSTTKKTVKTYYYANTELGGKKIDHLKSNILTP